MILAGGTVCWTVPPVYNSLPCAALPAVIFFHTMKQTDFRTCGLTAILDCLRGKTVSFMKADLKSRRKYLMIGLLAAT